MPAHKLTPLAVRLDRLLPDPGYPRRYPWRRVYFVAAVLTDLAMVAFSFAASYWFTFYVAGRRPEGGGYPAASAVFLASTFLTLKVFGRYDDRRLMRESLEVTEVIKAIGAAFVLSLMVLYATKSYHVSRGFMLLYLVFSMAAVPLARRVLRSLRRRLRAAGLDLTRVIVVGHNQTTERLLGVLESHPEWPLTPVAVVGDEWRERQRHGVKVLRGERRLVRYVKVAKVDEVLICKPDAPPAELAGMLADLKNLRIRSRLAARELAILPHKLNLHFDEVEGIPIIDYPLKPFSGWRALVKRSVDLLVSALIILVGAPLWGLISLAILVFSGRPVFFRQERVGTGGKHFTMFKFRTMRNEAVAAPADPDLAGQNVMRGPMFKAPRDARITWLGRWLRRLNIDEIPQMLNVLRGEMSLVGPRLPVPSEVAEYEPWHRQRLEGKVGVTGMWQIFGRDLLDFDDVVLLDVYYLSQGSLFLDYKILLRTAGIVLAGRPDPREHGSAS